MHKLRVGTRGSILALTQTRLFTSDLNEAFADVQLEEKLIATVGDGTSEPLSQATTPGLFVSALREALLNDEVDFIVHSMKDLPAKPQDGIVTACVPRREDSRDGLVSRNGLTLAELPPGARVGTSSPRRAATLRRARPDLRVENIRGNVDTRISKVERGDYDATLLAMAGLNRIGRAHVVSEIFENDTFVPAAGQGALSVECRSADSELRLLLSKLDDAHTRLITTAERSVLLELDAGCATAIGASAELNEGVLELTAELAVETSGEAERVHVVTPAELGELEKASTLGTRAAHRLLDSPLAAKAAWK